MQVNMITLILTHLVAGIFISTAVALGMAVLPAILWFVQRIKM